LIYLCGRRPSDKPETCDEPPPLIERPERILRARSRSPRLVEP
jgi:hypothetical protein